MAPAKTWEIKSQGSENRYTSSSSGFLLKISPPTSMMRCSAAALASARVSPLKLTAGKERIIPIGVPGFLGCMLAGERPVSLAS